MRQNDNSFSSGFYIYPPSSQLLHFSLSGAESNAESISDIVTAIQGTSEGTFVNALMPNDPYRGHTAPLTSKRCILYIYSTNIDAEYFKHGIYSPFFLFKMQFVS